MLAFSDIQSYEKTFTVIVSAFVYVLFHLSAWVYYVTRYSYTLCIHHFGQQLKNGRHFHTVNSLAPIRRLPRLNDGLINDCVRLCPVIEQNRTQTFQ